MMFSIIIGLLFDITVHENSLEVISNINSRVGHNRRQFLQKLEFLPVDHNSTQVLQ